MNNIRHMEFGPFGQPQPEKNDSFDIYFKGRKSAGGSASSVDTKRDVHGYLQTLEVAKALVHEKPYRSLVPMLSADVQGMIEENGEQTYIDALLSARRHFFRDNSKKRGAFIEKPAFLVHTTAARSVHDDIANIKLESRNDAAGYYVTANDGKQTIGFFIETLDREFVQSVHNAIVKFCSSGEKPLTPHEALRLVFDRHTKETGSRHHAKNIPFVWRGDLRFKVSASTDTHATSLNDGPMNEMAPLSWEDRAEAFVDCKKIARMPLNTGDGKETAEPLTYSFHGYLPPGRLGDPARRFIDETISGSPGGIFVYTRVLGREEECRILRSRSDILKYMCSVGLKGAEKTIEIDTVDRNKANEIHLWILNELRRSNDWRLRQDPLPVLKKAIHEYMTHDNPDKNVLIRLL